ncbi:hypothetical protein WISP_78668 [Willisornis vidua]|uniref:Core shell protein Gag P30 domain-containing protein n=1 Tax=Willisornis vidua TaxID=1566151 RepID=A0ABQ9DB68_9PASS|nr:hypothetical protein WISP_78668 [Willisornis vidua]
MIFVTQSWPDIRRKLEKVENWHEKELSELMKEAQKVYVRRDEERYKNKARVMMAVVREVNRREGAMGKDVLEDEIESKESMGSEKKGSEDRKNRRITDEEVGRLKAEGRCFFCREKKHIRKNCPKMRKEARVYQVQDEIDD